MNRRLITVAAAMAMGAAGAGDASRGHVPGVQLIVDRRDAAVAKAWKTYVAAQQAADKQLAKEADAIQAQAMASQNLKAANDAATVKADAAARAGDVAPKVELLVARYGPGASESIDVTQEAKAWLKGDTFAVPLHVWDTIHHDWPGRAKWLQATFNVGGNRITIKSIDDTGGQYTLSRP